MKIKLLFLLIIFNWVQIGYSQNVDSLSNIIKIELDDSLKIEYNFENKLKTHESDNLKTKNLFQSETIKNKNIFVILSIIVSSVVLFIFVLLLYNRKKLRVANSLLTAKNEEIKIQKEDLEKFNQKLFASNLKIDQQNIEVVKKNEQIQLQTNKLTEKTIDLLVLNREIRQTAKLREGLTNMIVHDLKNPISSIINLTENKEITYFAKEILTMVENILDVQKFEGMMMPLNKRDYSLKEITDSAVKQIEVFAEHKNIQIENKILKKHHVNIDEDIIRRVFVNLLSNAIKYTPANGFIKIDFEIKADKKDFILVKVMDSGIGIRKDKIDIIFNKFKQVMAKKTGMARSTGLGLTFCKMAVEAHDSKIVVNSVPGKETVFSFEFELMKKQNYDKSTENSIVSELNTTLNNIDKSYLKKFYDELKEFDVYEIGKLRKVTNQIDMNHSDGIHKWKLELEKAIYNCNSELYDEMVNSIVIDSNEKK